MLYVMLHNIELNCLIERDSARPDDGPADGPVVFFIGQYAFKNKITILISHAHTSTDGKMWLFA